MKKFMAQFLSHLTPFHRPKFFPQRHANDVWIKDILRHYITYQRDPLIKFRFFDFFSGKIQKVIDSLLTMKRDYTIFLSEEPPFFRNNVYWMDLLALWWRRFGLFLACSCLVWILSIEFTYTFALLVNPLLVEYESQVFQVLWIQLKLLY